MLLNAANSSAEDTFAQRYGKGAANMALGMSAAFMLFDATAAAVRHGIKCCKKRRTETEWVDLEEQRRDRVVQIQ